MISIDIRIANRSSEILRTVGGFYEAWGSITENPSKFPQTQLVSDLAIKLNTYTEQLDPWHLLSHRDPDLLSSGRVLPDRWLLAPGEEYKYQIITAVPCDRDVFHLVVNVFYHVHRRRNNYDYIIQWREQQGRLWVTHEIERNGTHESLTDREKTALHWAIAVRELAIPVSDITARRCSPSAQTSTGDRNGS